MKRLKVATVFGTRPEIIRLSRVIPRLDRYCQHLLIHTGQNHDYELSEIFFRELGLRTPDHFLHAARATAVETIAAVLTETDRVLAETTPDALLVLGDTNSSLAVIPAKRRKIPIFHMEAGNRCFDQRVPEEINRRIVDHTADINLTYSHIARENLLREGLRPDSVIKTGSPMLEVLEHNLGSIAASDIVHRLSLVNYEYYLVSAHREENVDEPEAFERLVALLNGVAEYGNLPVIVSTHPRTKKWIDTRSAILHERVRLVKPLGFYDYVHLQQHARAVLSDSGTISEEASILNFPAVMLRETHERHESMEEASVMMTGLSLERTIQALDILADQPRGMTRGLRQVADYSVPNVSDKVVRIIHSYTSYVNRTVWRKPG